HPRPRGVRLGFPPRPPTFACGIRLGALRPRGGGADGGGIRVDPKVTRFAQPIVQVLASFPANFIFPFATLVFVAWHIPLNFGAILLMALGAQWYILFNVIARASAIPSDLREAMTNLHVRGWLRWKNFILPA